MRGWKNSRRNTPRRTFSPEKNPVSLLPERLPEYSKRECEKKAALGTKKILLLKSKQGEDSLFPGFVSRGPFPIPNCVQKGTDPFLDSEKTLCLRVKCGSTKTQTKAPGIVWVEITRRHKVTKTRRRDSSFVSV
jgi:hypothetical protein